MSLRVSKTFGSRGHSQTEDPKSKFIFVFEGEKTEKQYFEGLFNSRVELGIKEILHIKTLQRSDGSKSHQKKVVEELHNSLQEVSRIKENREEIQEFIHSVFSQFELDSDEIRSLVNSVINGEGEIACSLNEIATTIQELGVQSLELDDFIEQLKTLKDLLDFEVGYDTVCIIIDRDQQSFKDHQYDEVLRICQENNYNLGVTNPSFEFWLLLHTCDCTDFDKNDLLQNRRISLKRRYLETLLVSRLGSYQKNNIHFEHFKPNIIQAIERTKLYCEDVILLKENLGSSIGQLLRRLIQLHDNQVF